MAAPAGVWTVTVPGQPTRTATTRRKADNALAKMIMDLPIGAVATITDPDGVDTPCTRIEHGWSEPWSPR